MAVSRILCLGRGEALKFSKGLPYERDKHGILLTQPEEFKLEHC